MLTQEFGHVQDFVCPTLWGLIETLTLKPSQVGHSSGMDTPCKGSDGAVSEISRYAVI